VINSVPFLWATLVVAIGCGAWALFHRAQWRIALYVYLWFWILVGAFPTWWNLFHEPPTRKPVDPWIFIVTFIALLAVLFARAYYEWRKDNKPLARKIAINGTSAVIVAAAVMYGLAVWRHW
jgi:hypothetical protein